MYVAWGAFGYNMVATNKHIFWAFLTNTTTDYAMRAILFMLKQCLSALDMLVMNDVVVMYVENKYNEQQRRKPRKKW